MTSIADVLQSLCFIGGLLIVSSQELGNRSTEYYSQRNWSQPKNYYESHPKVYYDQLISEPTKYSVRNLRYGPSDNYTMFGLNDEPVNRKPVTNGVFRTYGRGKAHVTKQGDTVIVPNDLGRKKAYKGTVTVRVVGKDEKKAKFQRGWCKECPSDQTVVASKGNSFVILPEPCPSNPRIWNHISGPRPGTKIREGLHVIKGSLGPKKKFCEYQYQVLVQRCEQLKASEEDTKIDCTEEDVWGSQCTITCGYEKEPQGPTALECMEDLKWSHPVPNCKRKRDCTMPKVKTNSKIWCQTVNMTNVEGPFITNGSSCRFVRNGREISLTCKEGIWRISGKPKSKKNKEKSKNKTEQESGPCDPNPCQNGGTCLRSEMNNDLPICLCRPQTQGARCELRECDYNICHNEGLCLFLNQERTCFCLPEYSGEQCQHQKKY